jgi:sensor domain CHASE-containing protein
MRVQTKLTLLLFFLAVILIAARYLHQTFENERVYVLFQQNSEEKKAYFNKLITLKGANLKSLSVDYTYWDDMVDFVRGTKDMAWARQNMDETVLGTYQADALWVYRLDLSRVYSIQSENAASLKDLLFPSRPSRISFQKSGCVIFLCIPVQA